MWSLLCKAPAQSLRRVSYSAYPKALSAYPVFARDYSKSAKPPIEETPVIKRRKPKTRKYPPPVSPEEAVTNIIYNTPSPPTNPPSRHIISCLVQNEPGVLSRVSGVLASRNFNIDSVVTASTEVPSLSRMTLVVKENQAVVEQAVKQLQDLTPVWAVLDYSKTPLIERELCLVKVSLVGPDPNLAINDHLDHEKSLDSKLTSLTFAQNALSGLTQLTQLFQGKVIDVNPEAIIIELSAKSTRVDAFMDLLRPYGILEVARTGAMAVPRSVSHDHHDTKVENDGPSVDASMLPPG